MESQFTYADLASITIAVIAVAIAVWSGYLTRLNNRLSVLPTLRVSHRFRKTVDFYGIRIINAGLGPAVVTSVNLHLNGSPVPYSHQGWMDALRSAGLNPDEWAITRLLEGTIIRANEEIWVFRCEELSDEPNNIIRSFSKLELNVDYQSLYKEKQPRLVAALASADLIIEILDNERTK